MAECVSILFIIFCNAVYYKMHCFTFLYNEGIFTFVIDQWFSIMKNSLSAVRKKIALLTRDESTWFTIAELCTYLNRSRPTIHKYKKENLIPYKKIGGRYYFNKKEIDRSRVRLE